MPEAPKWLDAYRVTLRDAPTWNDVLGQEAIVSLRSLVARMARVLEEPTNEALARTIPRGVVIRGKPGVGKTMAAAAMCSALPKGSEFYQISSMTQRRWQELTAWSAERAAAQAAGEQVFWVVLFCDEFERYARRSAPMVPDRDPAMLTALVFLDGISGKSLGHDRIMTVAATNASFSGLDPALMRRLPLRLEFGAASDISVRETLLRRHLGEYAARDLDVVRCAALFGGGAAHADIVEIAHDAIGAAMEADPERPAVTTALLEDALRRGGLYAPARNRDPRIASAHEAGHATCGLLLGLPVALTMLHSSWDSRAGRTELGELADSLSERQIQNLLAVAYSGQIAESILLPDQGPTMGSGSDIAMASRLCSELHGAGLLRGYEPIIMRAECIDERYLTAAGAVAEEARERARVLLEEHTGLLHRVWRALLERGSLTADELAAVAAADAA
jgi:cell division protease FtsH